MLRYPVFIWKKGKDEFFADFPDFPNCNATALGLPQALEGATKVLEERVRTIAHDGDALPTPTPLGTAAARQTVDGAVIALVAIQPVAKRKALAERAEIC